MGRGNKCGGGRIRTLGIREDATVFETVPLNHSGTPPNVVRYEFYALYEETRSHFPSFKFPNSTFPILTRVKSRIS